MRKTNALFDCFYEIRNGLIEFDAPNLKNFGILSTSGKCFALKITTD